jgi:hypothetical protein
MTSPTDLTLRIICLDPPDLADDPRARFGGQDKSQQLTAGQSQLDGSLVFTVPIAVKGMPGEGRVDTVRTAPDFAGPFVHGTPQQRFLYLSLGTKEGSTWRWIRRIKVPLSGITRELVKAATEKNGIVEGTVDGTRSGSVPLLGQGWVVKENK